MVAFRPVPTTTKHDRWAEKAAKVMGDLQALWLETTDGSPSDEEWPAIYAAFKHFVTDWDTAIQRILGAALGKPMTVGEVFREMGLRKPVRDEVTVPALRVRLWQGVKKGKWFQLDGEPARYQLTDPKAGKSPATEPANPASRLPAPGPKAR